MIFYSVLNQAYNKDNNKNILIEHELYCRIRWPNDTMVLVDSILLNESTTIFNLYLDVVNRISRHLRN